MNLKTSGDVFATGLVFGFDVGTGSIGYAANRALGVRLGRLEVILVLIALAAYWVSDTRSESRRLARLGA